MWIGYPSMPLEREEFKTWMELLREDVRGVQDRLDVLNGRTRETEQAVAVLQDRAGGAKVAAGVSAGVIAIAEAVKWVFGK